MNIVLFEYMIVVDMGDGKRLKEILDEKIQMYARLQRQLE